MNRVSKAAGQACRYPSLSRRGVLQGLGAATAVTAFSSGPVLAGQGALANVLQEATQPPPLTPGVLSSPSLIDEALARLKSLSREVLERSGIPGMAVAVVRDGETVFAEGFGLRRVGNAERVNADTVFQLASDSKSLGATVVATQVALGHVSWDTPIIGLLPWFALEDEWVSRHVTIGDLYAHRSGLPDHAGDDLEDLGYDRRTILERLRYLPLHPFRAHYAYTNFGLTAAAEAVTTTTGQDWASLSEVALYRPLGMSSTSSRFVDYVNRKNRAYGHVPVPGGYEALYVRQPGAQSPAGGASSSVRDMGRWMALVLQAGRFDRQQLLPTEALLPAVTAQMISAPSQDMAARAGSYGFGFGVGIQPSGRVALSHSGAFALGAGTNYMMIPSLGVGIVVLTNAAPVGAAEAVSAGFMDLVQFGDVTRDWFAAYSSLMAPILEPVGRLAEQDLPAVVAAPRSLDVYAGRYSNAYFGEVAVLHRTDALYLLLGPDGQEYRLTHWDGDSFIYHPQGENAPPGSVSQVVFEHFSEGRAGAMTVEFLDQNGLGTFTR